MIKPTFWRGRRVLVTGHTGFIGSWLSLWLQELQAEVAGFALPPSTTPSLFVEARVADRMKDECFGDVRDRELFGKFIHRVQPAIVFHLAAQPLVIRSYREPVETWTTNVIGTLNVLEAIRNTPSIQVVQVFTSDKCYENREEGRPFRESDPLGGADPYSASKAAAELAVAAWRQSYLANQSSISLATVRAGNIIGGGDWAEDRLIPDCIRAMEKQKPLALRSPSAIRPWQHVLDAISALLTLAQAQLSEPQRFAQAFNVGPESAEPVTVGQMVERVQHSWNGVRADAPDHVFTDATVHEANHLRLDTHKFMEMLGWRPRRSVFQSVDETVQWYRHRHVGGLTFDAQAACRTAIQTELSGQESKTTREIP